jgi:carbonic anhydrase
MKAFFLALLALPLAARGFDLARELDRAISAEPAKEASKPRQARKRAQPLQAAPSPSLAWQRLQEGNRRFRLGDPQHPNANEARRFSLAQLQKPFAAVLSCSDSRVPPEIIFDQGLGDLFVIRVAGNIAEPAVLASAEYAVEHLGCSLLLVLGHERCGAVKAAVGEWQAQGTAASAPKINLRPLLDPIFPAVAQASKQEGDLWDNSVSANARLAGRRLVELSPLIAELKAQGKLSVISARYDLDEGAVSEITE